MRERLLNYVQGGILLDSHFVLQCDIHIYIYIYLLSTAVLISRKSTGCIVGGMLD